MVVQRQRVDRLNQLPLGRGLTPSGPSLLLLRVILSMRGATVLVRCLMPAESSWLQADRERDTEGEVLEGEEVDAGQVFAAEISDQVST